MKEISILDRIKELEEFVELYIKTYAETQTHPSALQEAMVISKAKEVRRGNRWVKLTL